MSAWEERMRASLESVLSVPVSTGTPFVGLTDKEAEEQDRDRFTRLMIENTSEYDWEELPDWLQDVMRHAADEFCRWADAEPVHGEVIQAQFEVEQ